MNQISTKPPIEYPTVTVGGVPFQIKFSLGAWVQLNKAGVTSEAMREAFASGRSLSMTMQLAAAGLGKFNPVGDWESLDITATQLADRLQDGELKVIVEAVTKSLGKPSPGAEAAAPAQPAAE